MLKWIAKAIVQKGISFLPQSEKLNYWFQKNVTKGVFLTDEYFGYKITHARDHIRYFSKHSDLSIENGNVLELGTGWYPIIPMSLFLTGFKTVTSVDIHSWMNKESQLRTIEVLKEWREKGELDTYLDIKEDKWNVLVQFLESKESISSQDISKAIGHTPLVMDARKTDFQDNSFNFICSNNTFEHIPKAVLTSILIEFQRLLAEGGLMSHFIDMSDHFAHFDRSITIYNFLKFSKRKWNTIDNSIQPQNRMRFKDYKQIYKDLSISIIDEEIRKGSLELLRSVPVHKEFSSRYTEEELAISHGYLVSK